MRSNRVQKLENQHSQQQQQSVAKQGQSLNLKRSSKSKQNPSQDSGSSSQLKRAKKAIQKARKSNSQIQRDPSIVGLLNQAIINGEEDVVQYVSREVNFNILQKENDNLYLLHLAASYGQEIIVEFLIGKGLQINEQDKIQKTPLHYATRWRNFTVCKLLVLSGANVNIKDQVGNTAIVDAARHGYQEILHFLIKNGADVNTQDVYGITPLKVAADVGETQSCETLLNHGAKYDLTEPFWQYLPDSRAKIKSLFRQLESGTTQQNDYSEHDDDYSNYYKEEYGQSSHGSDQNNDYQKSSGSQNSKNSNNSNYQDLSCNNREQRKKENQEAVLFEPDFHDFSNNDQQNESLENLNRIVNFEDLDFYQSIKNKNLISEKDIDDKYDDYSDIDRDLSRAKNHSFTGKHSTRASSSQSLGSVIQNQFSDLQQKQDNQLKQDGSQNIFRKSNSSNNRDNQSDQSPQKPAQKSSLTNQVQQWQQDNNKESRKQSSSNSTNTDLDVQDKQQQSNLINQQQQRSKTPQAGTRQYPESKQKGTEYYTGQGIQQAYQKDFLSNIGRPENISRNSSDIRIAPSRNILQMPRELLQYTKDDQILSRSYPGETQQLPRILKQELFHEQGSPKARKQRSRMGNNLQNKFRHFKDKFKHNDKDSEQDQEDLQYKSSKSINKDRQEKAGLQQQQTTSKVRMSSDVSRSSFNESSYNYNNNNNSTNNQLNNQQNMLLQERNPYIVNKEVERASEGLQQTVKGFGYKNQSSNKSSFNSNTEGNQNKYNQNQGPSQQVSHGSSFDKNRKQYRSRQDSPSDSIRSSNKQSKGNVNKNVDNQAPSNKVNEYKDTDKANDDDNISKDNTQQGVSEDKSLASFGGQANIEYVDSSQRYNNFFSKANQKYKDNSMGSRKEKCSIDQEKISHELEGEIESLQKVFRLLSLKNKINIQDFDSNMDNSKSANPQTQDSELQRSNLFQGPNSVDNSMREDIGKQNQALNKNQSQNQNQNLNQKQNLMNILDPQAQKTASKQGQDTQFYSSNQDQLSKYDPLTFASVVNNKNGEGIKKALKNLKQSLGQNNEVPANVVLGGKDAVKQQNLDNDQINDQADQKSDKQMSLKQKLAQYNQPSQNKGNLNKVSDIYNSNSNQSRSVLGCYKADMTQSNNQIVDEDIQFGTANDLSQQQLPSSKQPQRKTFDYADTFQLPQIKRDLVGGADFKQAREQLMDLKLANQQFMNDSESKVADNRRKSQEGGKSQGSQNVAQSIQDTYGPKSQQNYNPPSFYQSSTNYKPNYDTVQNTYDEMTGKYNNNKVDQQCYPTNKRYSDNSSSSRSFGNNSSRRKSESLAVDNSVNSRNSDNHVPQNKMLAKYLGRSGGGYHADRSQRDGKAQGDRHSSSMVNSNENSRHSSRNLVEDGDTQSSRRGSGSVKDGRGQGDKKVYGDKKGQTSRGTKGGKDVKDRKNKSNQTNSKLNKKSSKTSHDDQTRIMYVDTPAPPLERGGGLHNLSMGESSSQPVPKKIPQFQQSNSFNQYNDKMEKENKLRSQSADLADYIKKQDPMLIQQRILKGGNKIFDQYDIDKIVSRKAGIETENLQKEKEFELQLLKVDLSAHNLGNETESPNDDDLVNNAVDYIDYREVLKSDNNNNINRSPDNTRHQNNYLNWEKERTANQKLGLSNSPFGRYQYDDQNSQRQLQGSSQQPLKAKNNVIVGSYDDTPLKSDSLSFHEQQEFLRDRKPQPSNLKYQNNKFKAQDSLDLDQQVDPELNSKLFQFIPRKASSNLSIGEQKFNQLVTQENADMSIQARPQNNLPVARSQKASLIPKTPQPTPKKEANLTDDLLLKNLDTRENFVSRFREYVEKDNNIQKRSNRLLRSRDADLKSQDHYSDQCGLLTLLNDNKGGNKLYSKLTGSSNDQIDRIQQKVLGTQIMDDNYLGYRQEFDTFQQSTNLNLLNSNQNQSAKHWSVPMNQLSSLQGAQNCQSQNVKSYYSNVGQGSQGSFYSGVGYGPQDSNPNLQHFHSYDNPKLLSGASTVSQSCNNEEGSRPKFSDNLDFLKVIHA